MPIAYSYVAFSSKPQEKGDSIRRQTEFRQRWLRDHPDFVLAEKKFEAFGVSRFRKLAPDFEAFLALVRDGHIVRGSALIVEYQDRFSRQLPTEHIGTLLEIAKAGIIVGTMEGDITLDSLNNWGLITAVVKAQISHQESKQKSERCTAAWQNDEGKNRYDRKAHPLPSWIDDDHKIIPEKKKAIVKLAKMCIGGDGQSKLVAFANANLPPLNTTWSRGGIGRLLRDEKLIGVMTTKTGEVHKDYYPAVLDANTFATLQSTLDGRKHAGGPTGEIANLFTTLMPWCIKSKGDGRSYLIHTDMMHKRANVPYVRYEHFERAMLFWLVELTAADLYPTINTTSVIADLEADLARVDHRIDELKLAMDGDEDLAGLMSVYRTMVGKQKKIAGELAQARAAEPPDTTLAETCSIIRTLAETEDKVGVRTRLKQVLRNLISRIDVQVAGDKTYCTVVFKSGLTRQITIGKTGYHKASGSIPVELQPRWLAGLVTNPAIARQA